MHSLLPMGRENYQLTQWILVAFIFIGSGGCGKPIDSLPVKTPDGATPVIGVAGFGSQCPYGFNEDPTASRLELWGCDLGLDRVELAEPLTPLYLQVDCKKKLVSVRKPNRAMDTSWELLPDGTFFVTVDGGKAQLKSDGPDRGACWTPLSVNLMGKVDCADRDKAVTTMESIYWLGKSDSASEQPVSAGQCRTPKGCYFYTKTTVKQCQ